jgi:hypothetical protein
MATLTRDKTWTDPAAVDSPLALKAIEFTETIERIVVSAKDPGFDAEAGWAALEALIDVERFERVGNDKAVMGWAVYRDLLNAWGGTTDFWKEFRRISEVGDRVFLELTEHNTPKGGKESVVNSMSVYQFDEAGRLIHLDIYLQHD